MRSGIVQNPAALGRRTAKRGIPLGGMIGLNVGLINYWIIARQFQHVIMIETSTIFFYVKRSFLASTTRQDEALAISEVMESWLLV